VISEPQRWSPPYWDDEHSAYATKLLESAEALVLGRRTYDSFAAAWPQRSGSQYTDKINAMPKYVASRTLTEASWNAEILAGDAVDAVTALKQEPGGDLLKFGTGALDRDLMTHELVDEFHFWMFPAIAGSGDHLLSGMIDTTHLELRDLTRLGSGIVVLVYAPK
jgi:dihydrofolate reductase